MTAEGADVVFIVVDDMAGPETNKHDVSGLQQQRGAVRGTAKAHLRIILWVQVVPCGENLLVVLHQRSYCASIRVDADVPQSGTVLSAGQ